MRQSANFTPVRAIPNGIFKYGPICGFFLWIRQAMWTGWTGWTGSNIARSDTELTGVRRDDGTGRGTQVVGEMELGYGVQAEDR